MRYCMILGNNFEETEAVAPLDLLKRAGVSIDTYGVGDLYIKGRSGITIKADNLFRSKTDIETGSYDGILLPGGPGVTQLSINTDLLDLVKEFYNKGKLVFAICAAPLILYKAGVLKGKKYTCFPGTEKDIHDGELLKDNVVVDGKLVTSRGMGTAIDAGLKLVEIIVSKKEADLQAERIVYPLYGKH